MAIQPFVEALPVLGIDGSLAHIEENNEIVKRSRGMVLAKTGTGFSSTFAGYLIKNNELKPFLISVNNVTQATSISDIVQVADDEGLISSILQQN